MGDYNTNIRCRRSSSLYTAAVLHKSKPQNSAKEIKIIKHFERRKRVSDTIGDREFPEIYCHHFPPNAEPKNREPIVPQKRSISNNSRLSKGNKFDYNHTYAKAKIQPQNNRGRKRNDNKNPVKQTGRRPPVSLSSSSSVGRSASPPKCKKAKCSSSSISIDTNGTSSNDFGCTESINKALRSVQNKIRINLNSIKDKEELRLSIKDVHYKIKPKRQATQKTSAEASVVTESYIEQLKSEINFNKNYQSNKQSPNIKELKSEISRYRKLIQCGGNVLDAMDFIEPVVIMPKLDDGLPSLCTCTPNQSSKAIQIEGMFLFKKRFCW